MPRRRQHSLALLGAVLLAGCGGWTWVAAPDTALAASLTGEALLKADSPIVAGTLSDLDLLGRRHKAHHIRILDFQVEVRDTALGAVLLPVAANMHFTLWYELHGERGRVSAHTAYTVDTSQRAAHQATRTALLRRLIADCMAQIERLVVLKVAPQ